MGCSELDGPREARQTSTSPGPTTRQQRRQGERTPATVSNDPNEIGPDTDRALQESRPTAAEDNRTSDTTHDGTQFSEVFYFDDAIFSPAGPDKPRMTCAQKRLNNRSRSQPQPSSHPQSHEPLPNISAYELRTLQGNDLSLATARQVADGVPSTSAGPGFFRRHALLYRHYQTPGTDEQLVLPVQCRPPVLKLAHYISLAGTSVAVRLPAES